MKRFISLLFFSSLIFAYLDVTAQVITTDPSFPSLDEPVTITFDAALSERNELAGYTGRLYTHTGTIMEPGAEWSNVIGTWGVNTEQPELTNIGTNLWSLHIEDIRDFYSLDPDVTDIHQLAFVFRSADATRQTEDLFVDFFTDSVNVRFVEPVSNPLNPYFGELNEVVSVEVEAASAYGKITSVSLFVENDLVKQDTTSTLEYEHTLTKKGRTTFRVLVENDRGDEAEETIFVTVSPDVTEANRPAGIQDGINYHEDDETKVTLSIFAPHKEGIYVIGDFNNWEVDPDYFMKRDQSSPDHAHYWLEIDGLKPGKEYGFQYLIDETVRVADAYAEKILDPWHDGEIIHDGRYPGLIRYPSDYTMHAVSVLQTAQEPYVWQTENFEAPAAEDLIIYELLIRDFLDGNKNTYQGIRDTLGYLENLGINALQLMPVNQFEGNLSWGYNPAFYFAPDKYYGPRRELKKLIDDAHSRGIAVILDMVWNHSFGQSPLLRMYHDAENNRPDDNNPWYMDHIFQNPAMNYGYKFDHGSPHFLEFMDRANRHWMEKYRVNGFRFDLTKGFTTRFKGSNDEWGSLYDQERIDNLIRMKNEIHAFDPKAYVILEHLSDNAEETVLANNDMLLWGNLNHSYNEATMGYQSNLSWGYFGNRNWNDPHLITYMESHDEQRLMWKNLQYGNANADYDIKNLSTALDRMILAGAFFFPIPGPKMLWQYGEIGYDHGLGEDGRGRTDPKPVPGLDYFMDPDRMKLFNTWRAIIALRRENEVFRTRNIDLSLDGFVKRISLYHDSMNVIVVGNFDVRDQTAVYDLPHGGTWWNYLTGESFHADNTQRQSSLKPGSFYIITSEKVELPEPITFTSIVDGHISDIPQEITLNQNYPNPFNPVTTVTYGLSTSAEVQLQVYNLLGQRVVTLVDGYQNAGTHAVEFDASRLSSGTYLLRLQAGQESLTRKMMLVK